jgi:DNA-directed RNA polymerase specialized sigma subunit
MNIDMDTVPATIDESIKMFIAALDNLEKEAFQDIKEKEVALFHNTFGEDIREYWSMWQKNTPLVNDFNSHGITHADDMSGIILTSTHRQLHKKPIKLKEQISKYQEYWKKEIGKPIP